MEPFPDRDVIPGESHRLCSPNPLRDRSLPRQSRRPLFPGRPLIEMQRFVELLVDIHEERAVIAKLGDKLIYL